MFSKFGFSGTSTFFEEFGKIIKNGFFIIFYVLGTIILAIGSAFASGFDFTKEWAAVSGVLDSTIFLAVNPYSGIGFGSVFLLLGSLGIYLDQNRQNKEIKDLEEDNREIKQTRSDLNLSQEALQESKSKILEIHEELVQTWLKGLYKQFNLDTHSRITVYYEYEKQFYLLARYSSNPRYTEKHRLKFSLNEGVISKAWQHGIHIEKQCPNHETSSVSYGEYMQENYGYDSDKITNLTMKSCRYWAKSIADADINIGVIVFESTEENFIDENECEKIEAYLNTHQSQLAKFVRDSLTFDKEVSLKRVGKQVSVESDLLSETRGDGNE
ncbi:hypothetical protein [Thiomicrorhabdus sp.]|uniref:hypothetical protein n=1 Tax=Thiomicrorhabdus sp. TaxID=2039724 RepID=UPI0029C67B7A|nr:hypothetical protein [Thiomicrorhabdus sp.]